MFPDPQCVRHLWPVDNGERLSPFRVILCSMRRPLFIPAAGDPVIPTARRLARWQWRDLRLWVGLALIVISMLAGARLLSSSQETVTVWRATRDLAPGAVPVAEPVTVVLGDTAAAYAVAKTPLVGRMRVPVAAGALIPADATAPGPGAGVRQVTIAVDPLHAPVDLAAGDVVDVWATASTGGQSVGAPMLVLPSTLVLQSSPDALGVAGQLAVVIEVPETQVTDVVSAVRSGNVDLVEVPLAGVAS